MGSMLSQIVLLALVFTAGCLVFLALAPLFAQRVDLRHRRAGTPAAAEIKQASLRNSAAPSIWERLVKVVESRGVSLTDAKSDALKARLIQAGYYQPYAPRLFMLTRVILTLVLPSVTAAVKLSAAVPPTPGRLYIYIALSAVAGLYAPGWFVGQRIKRRANEILNGFPDTLDLMLVCVEAGLGIDTCFQRVGGEVRRSHRLLSEQFEIVSLELRAGRSRADALRGLIVRTNVPEIASFVTLIIQSDRLGSSIGQALKSYAMEMREGRKMRAEEKAHRLPVMISIPLVAFMLPTMISVLLLPGIILVNRDLLPSLAAKK
jgi:tight adherence protein C